MLFPEKMLRVRIEIEPGYNNTVLEAIGNLRTLHIDKTKIMLSNEAEVSRVKILLAQVRKQMLQLGIRSNRKGSPSVADVEHLLDQAEEKLSGISTKVDDLTLRTKKVKEEMKRFARAISVKKALDTVIDIERLSKDLKLITMRIGIVTMESAELLRLAFKQKNLLFFDRPLFEQTSAVAVFCEEDDETDVNKAFATLKVNEISLAYFSDQAFEKQKQQEEKIAADKQKFIDKYSKTLQNIESQLYALYALEKAKSSLKEGENGSVLEGWIPKNVSKDFVKKIEHAQVVFLDFEGEAPVLIETP